MNQYTYFVLGILLGIGLSVFYFMNREEKIEKQIEIDQKIYSTKILDVTMENVVKNINEKIKELKRELTEEEKNEIIVQCYKEKFNIGKIGWLFKIWVRKLVLIFFVSYEDKSRWLRRKIMLK